MIYLDNNATTACHPKVLEAMTPYFSEHYGNAGSNHTAGWKAAHQVKRSRESIATLLGAEPAEIFFTSGASEGIQLALFGIAKAAPSGRNRILVSATEHRVVFETLHALTGYFPLQVETLPVDSEGVVDLQVLKASMSDRVLMVIAMGANNETGVMNPLEEFAELASHYGALFFCDTTQMPGKCLLDANSQGFHAAVLSAHKFYGPKGIGVLYMRRKNPRVCFSPPFASGSHEQGIRAGTLNVSGIVGMAEAARIATEETWSDMVGISALRTRFEQVLEVAIPVHINGSMRNRICNTSNLFFPGVDAVSILQRIPDIACSLGAACSSASDEPSHVLKAMHFSDPRIRSSIRFSLGKFNHADELDLAANQIIQAVASLRQSRA